ncbi:MAG TPA: hypothetical protein VI911_11045 [Patescibacteria group bacterium]|nr:hypothetical protein [Patescibacteria group bacterium]
MYRIITTTDHKYIGMIIDDIVNDIVFPDGFIMEVKFTKTTKTSVIISNYNYIITLRKEK